MEQIKNIIFDVGDVLLSYRWKYMLMDYGLSEEEAVRIGTEMFDDPEGLWGLLDLGTVPQQEIIERYCRKYPADEKVIRWFIGRYKVNMAEAANPDPAAYPTFNEFFTRPRLERTRQFLSRYAGV